MLIGLCGYARSGKDEFYKAVSGAYTRRLAFATRVKQEVQDFLNVHFPGKFDVINNDADKIFWRKLLVGWGDTCRKVDANIWIDKLKSDSADVLSNNSIIKYVTDVRYLNEAQWVLDNNGILIMIKRADVFADNDVEDETIGTIAARLRDKYFSIYNKGHDLETYHMACRCLMSNISQGVATC